MQTLHIPKQNKVISHFRFSTQNSTLNQFGLSSLFPVIIFLEVKCTVFLLNVALNSLFKANNPKMKSTKNANTVKQTNDNITTSNTVLQMAQVLISLP